MKWKICHDNGYNLLSISDFYWKDLQKQEIYKAKIRQLLNLNQTISIKDCIIKDINKEEALEFFQIYSICDVETITDDLKVIRYHSSRN